MPFIVTTMLRGGRDGFQANHEVVSRRAVATLDEARSACVDALPEDIGLPREVAMLAAQIRGLAASGGKVGPLPDGTVIEVRSHAWYEIATQAGIVEAGLLGAYAERDPEGPSAQKILAAFNARETGR